MAISLVDIASNKKNIIIVDPGAFTPTFVATQAFLYSRRGYTVTVYSSFTQYNQKLLQDASSDCNFSVKFYSISGSNQSGILKRIFDYLELAFTASRQARNNDANLFLNFGGLVLFDALLLLMTPKENRYYICHNPVEHGARKPSISHAVRSKLTSKVVVLSKYSFKLFKHFYSKKLHTKLVKISHGPIYATWADSHHTFNHRAPEKRIVFLGRVEPYKSADFIINLCKKLPDYSLEIYGKGASHLLPSNDGQFKNIKIFDSFISDTELSEIVSSGAIFILPYEHATQSGVLWLLKTYRSYFVSSKIPGLMQDIPSPIRNFISFKKGDYEEAVTAIRYCYKNHGIIYEALDHEENT